MEIKNLSQLKKSIKIGTEFHIIEHYVRPEYNGQTRKISKVQTNGFYSIIKSEPEHKCSKANNGLGVWCSYGKASDWLFTEHSNGNYTCILSGVFEIEVLKNSEEE